jgi:hypothetical protein
MQDGATGGLILLLTVVIVSGIENCLKQESMRLSVIISVTLNILSLGRAGAVARWADSKVLLSRSYDLWHAVWAGALGGFVLRPFITVGTLL